MSKIFWMGMFTNNSVGDHAQTVAVEKWLRKYLPNYEVVRLFRPMVYRNWNQIQEMIKQDDIIFLHSSGDFGSLFIWTGESEVNGWHATRRKIISSFPNNKIIQLPTTVNYSLGDERGKRAFEIDKEFYKDKTNITLMCREYGSYEIAKNLGCRVMMVPDFVFSTKPVLKKSSRKGALMIIRQDHEARFGSKKKEILKQIQSVISDVMMKDVQCADHNLTDNDRENYINNIYDYYQNFKVVITDRMHGMIFSIITGTPCVAIDDRIPHKLSGYKKLLFRSVKFVKDIEEIPDAIKEILSTPYIETDLSLYFTSLKKSLIKNDK